MRSPVVAALAVTPVKGTRVRAVNEIELGPAGARGNRSFFVIDERGRMLNAKRLGGLVEVIADHSESDGTLTLAFPSGRVISGHVSRGRTISTSFFSETLQARLIEGPFAAALSDHLGLPLRLVQADGAVDRGPQGAVSVISRASLARLAEVAEQPEVDPRRFRMLIEVDGVAAHAEDDWVGRTARVGEATVWFGGHVGRCVITTRHPERGTVDLPTLKLLQRYRRDVPTTEPLPFGIYGAVVESGRVRVGDPVRVSGA